MGNYQTQPAPATTTAAFTEPEVVPQDFKSAVTADQSVIVIKFKVYDNNEDKYVITNSPRQPPRGQCDRECIISGPTEEMNEEMKQLRCSPFEYIQTKFIRDDKVRVTEFTQALLYKKPSHENETK
jgi:hypothetical protein